MKTIILAAIVATAFALPASAESGHIAMSHVRNHHRIANAHASVVTPAPDPYAVFANGHQIGRDPDPNVRYQLLNEYWERLIN